MGNLAEIDTWRVFDQCLFRRCRRAGFAASSPCRRPANFDYFSEPGSPAKVGITPRRCRESVPMSYQGPDSRKSIEPLLNGVESMDSSEFHVALNAFNAQRLDPGVPKSSWEARAERSAAASVEEHRFLEAERLKVARASAAAPRDPRGFGDWFEALKTEGPGQFDPLFDFLAEHASYDQMRWFMRQEVAGEAGFDDLVALCQIKMPERAKLEMARNYWDEMGRGRSVGMHGPMLAVLAQEMGVANTPPAEIVWESLALANLLVGLAYNRRYAYHAIGALGVIELTAPTRAVRVVQGLERLGVSGKATYYFKLHSTVDINHFRQWRSEVLEPVVAEQPDMAKFIAEGAYMRLNAGARTFDRYRAEFGLDAPRAHRD